MTEGWHIGRDAIVKFCSSKFGVTSWRTIRRWKKDGFPIRYMHQGKPYIIEIEVMKFEIKVDEYRSQ